MKDNLLLLPSLTHDNEIPGKPGYPTTYTFSFPWIAPLSFDYGPQGFNGPPGWLLNTSNINISPIIISFMHY